ncbi:hypothetical protein K466DRAFT_570441 [Polyporus arcularius HHB13444]|uniref:Uncharacterized protein n=1 Tax=Polyporus arcularius HHB13444 TaxID=1314778 RepID=A0A5C3NRT9_9APHY|nr:hypothetical protein K466DRAFT_570441 [Polyporus arcularius HHB13444]
MGRSVSGGSSWRSWRGSRAESELDVGLGYGLVALHGSKTSLYLYTTLDRSCPRQHGSQSRTQSVRHLEAGKDTAELHTEDNQGPKVELQGWLWRIRLKTSQECWDQRIAGSIGTTLLLAELY